MNKQPRRFEKKMHRLEKRIERVAPVFGGIQKPPSDFLASVALGEALRRQICVKQPQ